MDEVAAVEDAALEAVGDVVPEPFHDDIARFIENGSLVPGVLTVLAAGAAGCDPHDSLDRAVGVQLIYDGLRLTRRLASDDPWATGDDPTQANIDILAADVLVARGFYLLAETEAATDAVGVVQSFGHDQTLRHERDDETLDRELEVDILELAIVAGASAAGSMPLETDGLARSFADHYDDGFPEPAALFDTAARERIDAVAGGSGRPLNRND